MTVGENEILLGEGLEKIAPDALTEKVKTVRLFARTTPDQKLLIVNALKKNGEIVAMMGDGVNDAPALHQADIGIVVGEATDVAKESADLVLLDSNFSTIVKAIEEGRSMFENIRKIILYLMS
ncbi:MAG: Calcium-translocating P-type ATPase, PMCA-type, partial [Candidatus Gottesmanbacteria bacterium GW2011_GWB1_44_11c]